MCEEETRGDGRTPEYCINGTYWLGQGRQEAFEANAVAFTSSLFARRVVLPLCPPALVFPYIRNGTADGSRDVSREETERILQRKWGSDEGSFATAIKRLESSK